MNRKTSISDSIGTTTYTYDALGRRTQRIDDREKGARPPIRPQKHSTEQEFPCSNPVIAERMNRRYER